MSTNFYRLAEPITALHVEEVEGHRNLIVWVDGKHAGTLILDEATLPKVLKLLHVDYDLRSTGGGGETVRRAGGRLYGLDPGWRDDMQLIDEYGQLTTVGEVKESMR